jgi:cell division protein FtsQ
MVKETGACEKREQGKQKWWQRGAGSKKGNQMAVKVKISRILFVVMWCIVGAGVLVLLGAAINYRNSRICKGYKIEITGPTGQLFIDRKAIEDLLNGSGAGKGQGRPIFSFDLRRMESALEKNVWVKDAQLFFDNNEILRVNVVEREPVARIFTEDGNSFYIDSSGAQLPLSAILAAKLPVFTGYPAAKIRLHGRDSSLTDQVRRLGSYIRNDSFWMAQIAQVDITAAGTFELVPTIGNHLIGFGDGNDCAAKFHRLFVFYKEVLSRTGFDKYSRVDVAYKDEVIGTKKGSEGTRTDSLQGMRNIQQLIRSAQQLQPDTMREQNIKPLERSTETEQTLTNYDLIPDRGDSAKAGAAKAVMPAGAMPAGKPAGKNKKQLKQ